MDLDDDELFNRCLQEIKEDRLQYYDRLYQKYVTSEDCEIELDTLEVVGDKRFLAKPFGFITQYKSKRGRKTIKILERRIRIRTKCTVVRYDLESGEKSSHAQPLEISNLDKKYSSIFGIKECFVKLKRLKEIGESSSKIDGLSEDEVLQLNCKTPKRKTLKNSKLNIDIDTLNLTPIDTLSLRSELPESSSKNYGLAEDKVLQLNYETPKRKTLKYSKLNMNIDTNTRCLTPKLPKSSTKYPINLTKSSPDALSVKQQLQALKESHYSNYSFRVKNESVLCRSPISACSSGLKQLTITDDSNGFSTDGWHKPNEHFPSSYIKRLLNDLEFPKIGRRCLFKTSENKVVQNELCSINLLNGNRNNISKVTDVYHKNNSPVFNRSCYPKGGKKIIEEITVEEDIYCEDEVIYMNTSVSPKSNSYNIMSCNTPSSKSTIKSLPCSPATPALSPKINLKFAKVIIKDDSRMNT